MAGAFVVAIDQFTARTAVADDDATVLSMFLKDGRSPVSYSELARVNDDVDWDRTRDADAARSTVYLVTQADAHYALLTAEIGQAT